MSAEATARLRPAIWAALDASEGDVIEAVGLLGERLAADPELMTAAVAATSAQQGDAVAPLAAPVTEHTASRFGQGDPRFGQALREWFDATENPTRTAQFVQAVMVAFVRALDARVQAERPAWRAARGREA